MMAITYKVRHWDNDSDEAIFEGDDKIAYNFWLAMTIKFRDLKYGRIYITSED